MKKPNRNGLHAISTNMATALFGTITLLIHGAAFAIPGDPVGNEFQVNSFTNNSQTNPDVALAEEVGFVIVWESASQDGDNEGVFAQRFSPAGIPAGSEFQVNIESADSQRNAKAAMDGTGNFVIVWESDDQDGDDLGVYARRFNADGSPAGDEFLVNTTTEDSQRNPSVAMAEDGRFVVTWHTTNINGDGDVFAQRFNNDGSAAGEEFTVNSDTEGAHNQSDVAINSTGNFIIVWTSRNQDGDDDGVYGQRFNADGSTVGDEYQINIETSDNQNQPAVTLLEDGSSIVTWRSFDQDESEGGIFARLFAANGEGSEEEFQVNLQGAFNQNGPDISSDNDGNFVITWFGISDGSAEGIYQRSFDASGAPLAAETIGTDRPVNTETQFRQEEPGIAMGANGQYVISWSSVNQDGSSDGVFAQRFGSAESVVGSGTPASCTEAAFDTVLANNSEVSFDCGNGHHTIVFTNEKILNRNTRILGEGRITLSGGGNVRLFNSNGHDLMISQLRLVRGNVSDGSGGAAILLNQGNLEVIDSLFSDHTAIGHGGAIRTTANSVTTISNSSLIRNYSSESGGAVFNEGELVIENSTVSRNASDGRDDYSAGGLTLDGSSTRIVNTTLAENKNLFGVGAIAVLADTTIVNSTIIGNNGLDSGGFDINDATATLTISNSLLADNASRNCSNRAGGGLIALGNNLTSDDSCLNQFTSGFSHANLAQINLGYIQEHNAESNAPYLLAGSAAIDAGDTSECTSNNIVTDQLGRLRDETCDIGAIEATGLEPSFMPRLMLNSNTIEDLLILAPDANNEGAPRLYMHRRDNGIAINNIGYPDNALPQAMALLEDMSTSGNGEPEIAVLGYFESTGQPRAKIKDSVTRANLGSVGFSRSQRLAKFFAIADGPDSGQNPELVLIGPRGNASRLSAEVRDSASGELLRLMRFNSDMHLIDAASVQDMNGNGASEIAVIGRRSTSGRYLLQIRDTHSNENIVNRTLSGTYPPLGLTITHDLNENGSQEIAILGYNPETRRPRVQLIDSVTRSTIANHEYIATTGSPRAMALLPPDGQVPGDAPGIAIQINALARSRDLHTGASETPNPPNFGSDNIPLDFTAGGHHLGMTPGPDGFVLGEVSALLFNTITGQLSVETRDSGFGDEISTVVIP